MRVSRWFSSALPAVLNASRVLSSAGAGIKKLVSESLASKNCKHRCRKRRERVELTGRMDSILRISPNLTTHPIQSR